MTITYLEHLAPVSAGLADDLLTLSTAVFGDEGRLDGTWRLANMPDLSAFTARAGDRLVGFKLGYAVTSQRYYSWLGGVHAEFRRRGIAEKLMHRQHGWISSRGYRIIETEVLQSNHEMAKLNEKVGFRPAGLRFDGKSPRIIYRKALTGPDEG